MSERRVRVALVVTDLFEAASAIVGALGLVVGFMAIPVSVLKGTPFTDFTVPAVLLGFAVGGSALAAGAITAFRVGPRRFDAVASAAAGSITVGWILIEVAMIGLSTWAQVFWGLVGVAMVVLACALWLVEGQEPAGRRQVA